VDRFEQDHLPNARDEGVFDQKFIAMTLVATLIAVALFGLVAPL